MEKEKQEVLDQVMQYFSEGLRVVVESETRRYLASGAIENEAFESEEKRRIAASAILVAAIQNSANLVRPRSVLATSIIKNLQYF